MFLVSWTEIRKNKSLEPVTMTLVKFKIVTKLFVTIKAIYNQNIRV